MPYSFQYLWNKVNGATHYEIEIDTSSQFTSPHLIQDTCYTNYKYISVYFINQKHYCRVRAVDAQGPGPWSQVRNFTTRALPSVQSFSTGSGFVASIITTTILYVNFQHEIDSVQTFDSPHKQTILDEYGVAGTNVYRDLFFKKKYYIRSRIITKSDTGQWANTISFTTLGGATILGIDTNAVGQDYRFYPGFYTGVDYPGAFMQFDLDTSQLYNSPVLVHKEDTLLQFDDRYSGRYQFGKVWHARIRSITPVDTSDWSVYKINTFHKPIIIKPSSVTVQPKTLTTTVGSHARVDYFIYRVDTTADFNSPIILIDTLNNAILGPSKVLGIPFFGRVWYGLRAVAGSDTSDEAVVSFLVNELLTYSSPTNNTTNQDVLIDFSWQDPKFVRFQWQLDSTPDFSSTGTRIENIQEGSTDSMIGHLYYGVNYYWRMRVLSEVDTGVWQSVWNFRTKSFPSLSWPNNNDTGYTKNWDITCDAIYGSDYYEFAVSETPNFLSSFYDTASYDPVWDEVAYGLGGMPLKYSTKYYWKARAIHALDTSEWSSVWNVTTASELPKPATVKLVSPANASKDLLTSVTLEWQLGAGEDAYWLQHGEDPNFGPSTDSILIFFIGNVNPTEVLKNLKRGATYYWRVRAENNEKQGDWSDVWHFQIIPEPKTPVPVFPVGVSNQGIFVKLRWNAVPGATSYRYRIGENSNLSTINPTSVTDTFAQVGPLKENKLYYWHVNSLVGSEQSTYCVSVFFETGEGVGIIEQNKETMQVYPNPARAKLYCAPFEEVSAWEILDMSGVSIEKGATIGPEGLDILALNNGMFILRIWRNDQILSFHFVRQ